MTHALSQQQAASGGECAATIAAVAPSALQHNVGSFRAVGWLANGMLESNNADAAVAGRLCACMQLPCVEDVGQGALEPLYHRFGPVQRIAAEDSCGNDQNGTGSVQASHFNSRGGREVH